MLNDKGKGGDGIGNCYLFFFFLVGFGCCIVSCIGLGWGERG